MGRSILLPKKGEAKDPGNYRAIACLNTQYKFATVVLADSLAAQIEANDLLPQEQRVLRKGARGCVDCLAVDKMVITDDRFKGLRTLSVGWIKVDDFGSGHCQDVCIYTRLFKTNCMGNAGDTHCRQCGEGVKTVRHILSQCCPKGINLYMERHDRALLVDYYDLCKHNGFEVMPRWWEFQTLPVRENHWDVPIPTDKDIVACRPDIFLQDTITRHLIEMAFAWDSIQGKEEPRSSLCTGNFARI